MKKKFVIKYNYSHTALLHFLFSHFINTFAILLEILIFTFI